MVYLVNMPYFRDLSNNSYKIGGTYATKGPVKSWMKELADKPLLQRVPEAEKYKIYIKGFFCDRRHPDVHNLHKVIGDSLKKVLPKDDKYYLFEDEEPTLGSPSEFLSIRIEPLGVKK